jgi:hypothetical protein
MRRWKYQPCDISPYVWPTSAWPDWLTKHKRGCSRLLQPRMGTWIQTINGIFLVVAGVFKNSGHASTVHFQPRRNPTSSSRIFERSRYNNNSVPLSFPFFEAVLARLRFAQLSVRALSDDAPAEGAKAYCRSNPLAPWFSSEGRRRRRHRFGTTRVCPHPDRPPHLIATSLRRTAAS